MSNNAFNNSTSNNSSLDKSSLSSSSPKRGAQTAERDTDAAVIVTEHQVGGGYGEKGLRVMQLTLNAERSLNALTLEMIRMLMPLLRQWQQDDSVACILLDGSGQRAFCAGGDIRSLYTGMTDPQQRGYCLEFFSEEYRLDYLIHRYPKPLICWGSGLVMGGGLGLMSGAGYRVVTETSQLSMPEVSIGLFPDVGGTWFLSRMPGRWGLFLALSACAINGRDAQYLGLADICLRAADKTRLLADLCAADWQQDPHRCVADVLQRLSRDAVADMPAPHVPAYSDQVNALMGGGYLPDVIERLSALPADEPWLGRVPAVIEQGSPAAMAFITRQLHQGRHFSLAQVFRSELSLAMNISESGEFAEGIRALLIDKDRQPSWRFQHLSAVDRQWLDQLFEPRWTPSRHPLARLEQEVP